MKKLIYIVILIAVIILGVYIGIDISKEEKTVFVDSKNTENKINNNAENTVEEKQENITENIVEENEEEQEQIEEEKKQEPKTDLEKAIDIVKDVWGDRKDVKYLDESDGNTPEGEYIICIREEDTTNAIIWYKVNVETGTATIK